MELNLETSNVKYQLQGHTATAIIINDQQYFESIIIMPQYLAPWHVSNIKNLTTKDMLDLCELQPELILLGTGSNLIFPQQSIMQATIPLHIGVEVMNTAAACRTYVALTAENRNIVAALIIDSKQR